MKLFFIYDFSNSGCEKILYYEFHSFGKCMIEVLNKLVQTKQCKNNNWLNFGLGKIFFVESLKKIRIKILIVLPFLNQILEQFFYVPRLNQRDRLISFWFKRFVNRNNNWLVLYQSL